MPPPSSHPCLHLQVIPEHYYVVKFPPGEGIPDHLTNVTSGKLFSITRTEEEISVVGEVSTNGGEEANWRCIKIAGPMDFGLTGVLASFTSPLKDAGIPVFAISTWNTDYILVPKEKILEAIHSLKTDGWIFLE